MEQITIYELLPFLKHGFCVFTRSGIWIFYRKKPEIISFINFFGNKAERWQTTGFGTNLSEMFNIAPFEGDWKDSLMECGGHIADVSKKVVLWGQRTSQSSVEPAPAKIKGTRDENIKMAYKNTEIHN